MRGFDLLEQLDLVDSAYLDAAEAAPSPRRRHLPRWGAAAACAALLLGLGVWSATRGGERPAHDPVDVPGNQTPAIEIAPDIAWEDPGSFSEPPMKTIPGFEVRQAQGGAEAVVTYYVLPWIGYGEASGGGFSLDFAPPEGSTWRDLTETDILALVGGEAALRDLLAWEGMEFSGSVTHDADGRVWMLELWGESAEFAFDLELSTDTLPPSCIYMPPDYVTEIWGVEVAGSKGGIHGYGENREVWMPESRQVEFIANDVGCRFHLYGLEGQSEAVETMVSRFVRHAIVEGLNLSAVLPD